VSNYKDAACWIKKDKKGNDYLSVKVEMQDGTSFWVNLFKNNYKNKDNQPDYKLPKKPDPVPAGQSNKSSFDPDEQIPF